MKKFKSLMGLFVVLGILSIPFLVALILELAK